MAAITSVTSRLTKSNEIIAGWTKAHRGGFGFTIQKKKIRPFSFPDFIYVFFFISRLYGMRVLLVEAHIFSALLPLLIFLIRGVTDLLSGTCQRHVKDMSI